MVIKLIPLNVIIFTCLWSASGLLMSADFPPGWPWRGVNIVEESNGFSPERLASVIPKRGVNSVVLRMLPRKRAKEGGLAPQEAWRQSLAWVEKMLDECKNMGIVATVVIERGFPLDFSVGYDETSPEFWGSAHDRSEVINLASDLSRRFASRGSELAAYQILSEPVMIVDGKSLVPPQWGKFVEKLIDAMRKNDPKRWIAVTPPPWASPTNYGNFSPLPFSRIIYNAHMFQPHSYTHQGLRKYETRYTYPGIINGKKWNREQLVSTFSRLRNFQLKYDVPVWIGSFSAVRWAEGAEHYIKDVVSISNEYGWSWSYFAINGWHGWNPRYNSEYCCPPSTYSRLTKKQNVGVSSKRWSTLKKIFEPLSN